MEIAELKAQLNALVYSMFVEGILDAQFSRVQALQDASNPNFVTEVITIFCTDVQTMIMDFDNYLGQQNLDYQKMDEYAHRLKGSSSCIGAHRLNLASVDLRQASEDKDKEGCVKAMKNIAREYLILRSKFQTLVQLEERILDIQNNQQQWETSKQAANSR